jgi:hypothetical protein
MLNIVVLHKTLLGEFMKRIFLSVLILNSLTVFAVGTGQQEQSICQTTTQSGRNEGAQKAVKEKTPVAKEQETIMR